MSDDKTPTPPTSGGGADPCAGGGKCPCTNWPINIKGKLFWTRTWDYNDETKAGVSVKEFLPGAKAELHTQAKGASAASAHSSVDLTDDGEFAFTNVAECSKLTVQISLEHRGGIIVSVKGKTIQGNAKHVDDADFHVHTGATVWHELPLPPAKLDGCTKDVDLGEVEITRAHFVDICDAYKSVWFGHKRLIELGGTDQPICQINYPQDPALGVSNASVQMDLAKDDLKDRDVILHEYGHFIGTNVLGGLVHPGYGYNDDATRQHGRTTKEHYEAAWNEGHATFLSCALTDDAHYHDGYDTNLNFHLDTDNTLVGPHSEGSIQEALWRIYKVHNTSFKDGFWKAFSDRSKRTVRTIFDFFDNWKDLGIGNLDKVVESYKKFNMQYGYKYLDGTDKFGAVAAPKKYDLAKKQFEKTAELYEHHGKLGSGTEVDYNEEFYNRNVQFNAGSLAAGSTIATPKVTAGTDYIVPDRMEVKA